MGNIAAILEESAKLSEEERSDFLVEFVSQQNVLWVANAVKKLEDKFGVKAAAAVVGAVGPAAAAPAEKAEEQTSFDVVLKSAGAQKIQVIKAVRAATNLGLKEAKELVDKGGQPVKTNLSKEEADKLAKELKDAGAEVEIK